MKAEDVPAEVAAVVLEPGKSTRETMAEILTAYERCLCITTEEHLFDCPESSGHLCPPVSVSAAAADGAAPEIVAARLAGNVGDVLGGLDDESVNVGRLAGRVETLQWAQAELQLALDRWRALDRFADTRGLEDFLVRVQDSLRAVQDGSGAWAGLVRSVVGDPEAATESGEGVPDREMGG
jgi:hypothetical protein